MSEGLCLCGCGGKAKEHNEFIFGHSSRGKNNPNYKDGRIHSRGYILIKMLNHPRKNPKGLVAEHILVAEKVLGKHLPKGAEVHHVDRNRSNNSHDNLVICQGQGYHNTLHKRLRSYMATGKATFEKCPRCGEYGDPKEMNGPYGPYNRYSHKGCNAEYERNRYIKKPKEILTSCKRGHPFDESNTRIDKNTGKRKCRACQAITHNLRKEQKTSVAIMEGK